MTSHSLRAVKRRLAKWTGTAQTPINLPLHPPQDKVLALAAPLMRFNWLVPVSHACRSTAVLDLKAAWADRAGSASESHTLRARPASLSQKRPWTCDRYSRYPVTHSFRAPSVAAASHTPFASTTASFSIPHSLPPCPAQARNARSHSLCTFAATRPAGLCPPNHPSHDTHGPTRDRYTERQSRLLTSLGKPTYKQTTRQRISNAGACD